MTELARVSGGTFIPRRGESDEHQVQRSLRNKLRKNPHPTERPPAKSFVRAGVTRIGFFCGRHIKRLVESSGRAVSRGVFGRRFSSHQTTMSTKNAAVDSLQHSHQITTDAEISIKTLACPADGVTIDEDSREGMHVECPRCHNRWRLDQVVIA